MPAKQANRRQWLWRWLWLAAVAVALLAHTCFQPSLADSAPGEPAAHPPAQQAQAAAAKAAPLDPELERQALLKELQERKRSLADPQVRDRLAALQEAMIGKQPLMQRIRERRERHAHHHQQGEHPHHHGPADARAHSSAGGPHIHDGYQVGTPLPLECLSPDNDTWKPIPCVDHQHPVQLIFGVDAAFRCRWPLYTEQAYEMLREAVAMRRAIHCRVPLDNEQEAGHLRFFAPVTLSLWGIAEATHLHVNTHVNFVFHAHRGYILGAAAYSVRDHFQVVTRGDALQLHGKVHWFDGHEFVSYVHQPFQLPPPVVHRLTQYALLFAVVLFASSALFFYLLYQRVLKVRLAKQWDPTFKAD